MKKIDYYRLFLSIIVSALVILLLVAVSILIVFLIKLACLSMEAKLLIGVICFSFIGITYYIYNNHIIE
jgi:hypothetical protein